ncbi:MAG: hypothetical protein ACOC3Z_03085 [Nanoarchaeota archaeon]
MKYEIKINIESDKDKDVIKAFIIYSLRMLSIKKEDIKIKELKK